MKTRASRPCGWVLLLLLGGCAPRARGPGEALQGFGRAVEEGDLRAAYALLSDDARKRLSYDEFASALAAGGAESRSRARTLHESGGAWAHQVTVRGLDGAPLTLVYESGGWRLAALPWNPFGQETPRAALKTFVRAIDAHRYDILLRLAPARQRAALTEQSLRSFWEGAEGGGARTRLARLRLALDEPITEEGEEAYLLYDGRQAELVREEGGWRLRSFE